MEWKKRRVSFLVWEASGFKITEDVDGEDKPYRLDSPHADTEWFGNIETAKAVAKLQNDLALAQEDNERLRAELAQVNGVWPDDRTLADQAREALEDDAVEEADDGRGIPLPIRELATTF